MNENGAETFREQAMFNDAIAAGFGLPIASLNAVLFPAFEYRLQRRLKRLVPVTVSRESLHPMPPPIFHFLRAASQMQHDARRGTGWEWALTEAERCFDEALAHYIAGCAPDDQRAVAIAVATLGPWGA